MTEKKEGWFQRRRGPSAESLRADLDRMVEEVDAANEALRSQLERCAGLETDLMQHKAEITELQAEKELLQSVSEDAEKKESAARRALEKAQANHVQRLAQLEAELAKLSRGEGQLKTVVRREVDEERRRGKQALERIEAARRKSEANLKSADAARQKAESAAREAERQREDAAKQWQKERAALQGQLGQAQAKHKELETRLQQQAAELSEREKAAGAGRAKQERTEAQVKELTERLQRAEAKQQDPGQGEAQLRALRAELEGAKARCERLERSLSEEQEAEARTRTALEQERKSAEEALSQADDRYQALESRLREQLEEARVGPGDAREWADLVGRLWRALTRVLGPKAALAFSRELPGPSPLAQSGAAPSLKAVQDHLSNTFQKLSLCGSTALSDESDGLVLELAQPFVDAQGEVPPWLSVVAVQCLEDALGRRLSTTSSQNQEHQMVVRARFRQPGIEGRWAAS